MKPVLQILFLVCLSVLIFSSCEDNSSLTAIVNNPPEITVNLESDFAAPNQIVAVKVIAKDPDGDTVYIKLSVSAGELLDSPILDTLSNAKTNITVSQDWQLPSENGIYYLRVIADDSLATTIDSVSVDVQQNPNIPGIPTNIFPKPGTDSLGTYITLKWNCKGKKDSTIYYDLYFGTTENPTLIEENLEAVNEYILPELDYGTTYYWQISAKYSPDSDSVLSAVWNFSTREANTSNEQNLEFVTVQAGVFTKGELDVEENIDYDYQIMKYEVKNSEFVEYLNKALTLEDVTVDNNIVKGFYDGDENFPAGIYTFADFSGEGRRISFDGASVAITPGYESHPITNITWFGANAFARFYNLRLPTNDEWEKAARGNTGLDFPGFDTLAISTSNYAAPFDIDGDEDADTVYSPWQGTSPVGSYNGSVITPEGFSAINTIDSKSYYGCYDMAGNVWEWTTQRLKLANAVCGGSYIVEAESCKSFIFYYYGSRNSFPYIGFRCVKK